jgi:hypothetical protein
VIRFALSPAHSHVLHFPVTGRERFSARCRLLPPVRDWCRANLKHRYVPRAVAYFERWVNTNEDEPPHLVKGFNAAIDFEDEADAVLFKTRWL